MSYENYCTKTYGCVGLLVVVAASDLGGHYITMRLNATVYFTILVYCCNRLMWVFCAQECEEWCCMRCRTF